PFEDRTAAVTRQRERIARRDELASALAYAAQVAQVPDHCDDAIEQMARDLVRAVMASVASDDADPTTPGLLRADEDRDARRDEDALATLTRGLDPALVIAIKRTLDVAREGGDVLVLVDQELVRTVQDLVRHLSSPIAAAPGPESPDAAPSVGGTAPRGQAPSPAAPEADGGAL